jgi:CDP-6-deoxy-D-xylo-4-hexulose-3-dehydrase
MIALAKDTISKHDIAKLISWLQTNPKLTMGELTERLEAKWAKWLGVRYSVFVNSGSSANLLAVSALKNQKDKRKKIIVPAVSWSTTVMPVIQLGFTPILCDANLRNLGVDLEHFEKLCRKEKPLAAIVVHVLGIPCDIVQIRSICHKYDVTLLEDCCEAVGSMVSSIVGDGKVGTFGEMSTISTYFGHLFSTIEGGFIGTSDQRLFNFLKASRSHGWARNMDREAAWARKQKYNIDDFHELYTFYEVGFNLRSTDLQAFIGLQKSVLETIYQGRRDDWESSISGDTSKNARNCERAAAEGC